MEEDKVKIFNVGLLSVAFLIIFAAFQPVTNIQTVILDSAANKSSNGMYYVLWTLMSGIFCLKYIYF